MQTLSHPDLHFIWVFTVCRITRLGVSRIQRVNGDTNILWMSIHLLLFLVFYFGDIVSLPDPLAHGELLWMLDVCPVSSTIASKDISL